MPNVFLEAPFIVSSSAPLLREIANSTVELNCVVGGIPQPAIKWRQLDEATDKIAAVAIDGVNVRIENKVNGAGNNVESTLKVG